MKYDLNTDIDRERFDRRVEYLKSRRTIVEFTEVKPRRTTPQNSYLHVILGEFAMRTGNTIDYVKVEYFKRHCNAEIFERKQRDAITGKEVSVLRSSRDLDTAEMTIAIDRFRDWAAAEAGIDLPDAEDHKWLEFIEREMQYNKRWI